MDEIHSLHAPFALEKSEILLLVNNKIIKIKDTLLLQYF